MSQYLGDISAYALAVSQGYTGTEEEYAELMASYATVGQTAVTAAQTATTKASEAATSATTATTKASEATTAATTATTKAGEASTSASTATSAKDTAVIASQTATTKATEATTAAATATSAKTEAVAANTAAQSAKTAAQTAQTGAETAAANVQSSAAQIATNTEDITQLKSDLNEQFSLVGSEKINFVTGRIKSGTNEPVDFSVEQFDGFICAIVDCNYGDKIIINGTGGNVARLWAMFDANNRRITMSESNAIGNNLVLDVPLNGVKVVINQYNTSENCYRFVNGLLVGNKQKYDLSYETLGYKKIIFTPNFGVMTNVHESSDVSLMPIQFDNMRYAICDCTSGDTFIVNGSGSNNYRLWAILDSNNKLIAKSDANVSAIDLEIVIPQNGAKFVINQYNTNGVCYKIVGGLIYDISKEVKSWKNLPLKTTKIDMIVYGVSGSSSIFFGSGTGFFCAIEPNTSYYIVNPGGNRFKLVTASFDAYKLYQESSQNDIPSDGIFYQNDTTENCTITTKYTDRFLYVYCDTATGATVDDLIVVKGTSKEDINKVIIPNGTIPSRFSIGYSIMDTHQYYSSDLSYRNIVGATITDLYNIYDSYVTSYPNQVTKETFCTDTAGNISYIYHIKAPRDTVDYYAHKKKEILIICGTHGSEHPQMFHTADVIGDMLANWESDDTLATLLWNFDISVIPCLNVYGFINKTRKNERGVDLNRNYLDGWNKATDSIYTDPSSEYYHGPSPFSEVQSCAVRDYVNENSNRLCLVVDFHYAGAINYVATYGDFVPAFLGWERTMESWLYRKGIGSQVSSANHYTYVTSFLDLGSTARYINNICPALLLETLNSLDLQDDANNKLLSSQCSETALVNALLYAIRYMTHKPI